MILRVKNEHGDWVNIPAIIGPMGPGVPEGGQSGQILWKTGDNDDDTDWITPDFPTNAELDEVADARIPDNLVSVETVPSTNNTINWLYE